MLSNVDRGIEECGFVSLVASASISLGPRLPGAAQLLLPEMLPLRRAVREPTAGWNEHCEISCASFCRFNSWQRSERRRSQISLRCAKLTYDASDPLDPWDRRKLGGVPGSELLRCDVDIRGEDGAENDNSEGPGSPVPMLLKVPPSPSGTAALLGKLRGALLCEGALPMLDRAGVRKSGVRADAHLPCSLALAGWTIEKGSFVCLVISPKLWCLLAASLPGDRVDSHLPSSPTAFGLLPASSSSGCRADAHLDNSASLPDRAGVRKSWGVGMDDVHLFNSSAALNTAGARELSGVAPQVQLSGSCTNPGTCKPLLLLLLPTEPPD